MSKKKNVAPSASQAPGGRKYLTLAGVFVLAFVLAFGLAWALFRQEGAPAPAAGQTAAAPARTLKPEDLKEFLQAVEAGDYIAVRDRGEKLFVEGTNIPGSAGLFSAYATNSYPPNAVYSFLSEIGGGTTRRVMLTIDQEDKVVSFMAEEMNIVK